jgi:hypothetical protein
MYRHMLPLFAIIGMNGADVPSEYPPPDESQRSDLGAVVVHAPPTVFGPLMVAEQGLFVREVLANSTASVLGIQDGDVVLTVNGTSLTTFDRLQDEFSLISTGDTVGVTIWRNGARMQLEGTAQKAVRSRIKLTAEEREYEQTLMQIDAAQRDRFRRAEANGLVQYMKQYDVRHLQGVGDSDKKDWTLFFVIPNPATVAQAFSR